MGKEKEKKELFRFDMRPLPISPNGNDKLPEDDDRNKTFSKQRKQFGFATCDFWNFNMYLFTMVRNCAVQLLGIGSYPVDRTDEQWKSELERVVALTEDLLDNDPPLIENGLCELMDWLKDNIFHMWY